MRKRMWIAVVAVLLLSMLASGVMAQGINTGVGQTNIFMQNLGSGNAQVTVNFYRQDTGTLDWAYTIPDPIPPKGGKTLLYRDFGVGDNWAGAAELASTEPLAAIVNMFWEGNNTGAAYSGIDAPATDAFLPNLLKRAERQTRVTVQNTEATQATVSLKFYNRSGTLVGTFPDTIPGKAEKTYNLDDIAQCDFSVTSGVGSLHITSNTKIATMASLHYSDGSAAYSGVSTGDTVIWGLGIFRRVNGDPNVELNWKLYSAVIIQNLGSLRADVTVNLIGKGALPSTSFTDTIEPKASYGVNTKSRGTMPQDKWDAAIAALGANWNGTLKATCTNGQPLAGVVLYWNRNTTPLLPDLAAYEAVRNSDATTNALSMPAVYRKRWTPTMLQWSTSLVQNLDNTTGTINVKFFTTAGTAAGNPAGYDVELPANGSVGLNLKQQVNLPNQALTDLGENFSGAMYITSTTGQHIIGNTIFFREDRNYALGYSGFPVQ